MDVLRILGSTDIEVRRKTLDFLMSLISLRNVKDVVSLLKKEVIKTYSNTDKDREFRRFCNFCNCSGFIGSLAVDKSSETVHTANKIIFEYQK